MALPTAYLLGRDPLGTVGAQQPSQDAVARRPTASHRHRRASRNSRAIRPNRPNRSSSGHCCCSLGARLRFCLDQLAQLSTPRRYTQSIGFPRLCTLWEYLLGAMCIGFPRLKV